MTLPSAVRRRAIICLRTGYKFVFRRGWVQARRAERVGEGARREGADDYRVSFYSGDELDDMAWNEHTAENNHGSRSFHWLILHHRFERAGFPGSHLVHSRANAALLSRQTCSGKQVAWGTSFVWQPATAAGRAQTWTSLLVMYRFRCEDCSSRYKMETRVISSAQLDSGTSV